MKKAISIVFLACMMQISLAGALVVENYSISGGKMYAGDSVYDILYKTESFFNGRSLVRYIVEDSTKISMLSGQLESMEAEKAGMEAKITELEASLTSLNETLPKSESVLEIIRQQKEGLEAQSANLTEEIEVIEKEIKELESTRAKIQSDMTANITLSPSVYRISIGIFIILLLAVIATRGRALLGNSSEKKEENTE